MLRKSYLSGEGYSWGGLPANSLVVDVGGGVGTQTMVLAKAFPQLKFVIQDREGVVPDGIKVSHQILTPKSEPKSPL